VNHADTTINNHIRENCSTYHVANFKTITGTASNGATAQGFRSANEIRFYQAPEWNSIRPFCSSDSWSLGELLILWRPSLWELEP
jgi:hypothetical protein